MSHVYVSRSQFETVNGSMGLSRNGGYIVFFSHQWLSRGYPDPTGSQLRDMAYAVEEIARQRRIEINHILIWIDYCSIPQRLGLKMSQDVSRLWDLSFLSLHFAPIYKALQRGSTKVTDWNHWQLNSCFMFK